MPDAPAIFKVISKSVGLLNVIQSLLIGIGAKQVNTPKVQDPQPPDPKADPGTAHPPLSVGVVEQAPPLVELTQRFPPPDELMVSVLIAVLVMLKVLQWAFPVIKGYVATVGITTL